MSFELTTRLDKGREKIGIRQVARWLEKSNRIQERRPCVATSQHLPFDRCLKCASKSQGIALGCTVWIQDIMLRLLPVHREGRLQWGSARTAATRVHTTQKARLRILDASLDCDYMVVVLVARYDDARMSRHGCQGVAEVGLDHVKARSCEYRVQFSWSSCYGFTRLLIEHCCTVFKAVDSVHVWCAQA